ncbi:MAG: thiol:disulfide interchange protein [Methylocystaceae bacterium]|nr:MAG: thiol:disulfide interchange protein [Methylocystaceae bacterium]
MNTATPKGVARLRHSWWKPLALLALIGLLTLFGLGLGRDSSYLPSALVGKPAPRFELAMLDGEATIRVEDFLGKPLIVNFWASWCGACRAEHDVLIELSRQLAQDGSVRMLGVNYRDADRNARSFQQRLGAFPYPSAIDREGRTGVDFGVFGLPETFFITADGKVAARHIGPLSLEDARRRLRSMGIGS